MKKIGLTALFLCLLFTELKADTLYLKNGRSIDGLVKNENEEEVELDVGFGTIKFARQDVKRIHKSSPEESLAIQKNWERKKIQAEEERLKKEFEPKDIPLQADASHIAVNTVINGRVPASLILDTGASLVVLTKNIARKLGIDTEKKEETLHLKLADGRKINAMYMLLENIRVQDIETKDVDAAILLEDIENLGFQDGLLGMSFLNRFNFKVDQKNKRLTLEKLR